MDSRLDPAVVLLDFLAPALEIFGEHIYLQAMVLLALTLIAAKLVDLLMTLVVHRLVRRSRNHLDDQIATILHQPVFTSVVLIGLGMAVHVSVLSDSFTNGTLTVLRTIAVIVWAIFLLRLSSLIMREMAAQERFKVIKLQSLPLFQNISIAVIVSLAIYFTFLIWDVDMSAWLASAGIMGIVFGLAAKDTLANLFSGVFIMADAPYKIGDFIVLDSGERGEVTAIGIRSTRLLTRDDVEVTIPNAIMGNTRIINESGGPSEKFRVRVKVGAAYGSDIDEVKAILLEVATAQEGVCSEPEPRVRFRGFGDSSLRLELLCWVSQPVLRGRILDVLYSDIYKTFQIRGIEIPYAKQDMYIKELPAPKS